MTTEREKRLEEILCNFLRPMRDIPFELFIQGLFEQRVVKFDKSRVGNLELLNLMKQAMRNACHEIQAQPIVRPRPNEVGNDMEQPAIEHLRRVGLDAKRPKTRDEKGAFRWIPGHRNRDGSYGSCDLYRSKDLQQEK